MGIRGDGTSLSGTYFDCDNTIFGDGSDGDVFVSGGTTTSLTRDMFYNNLTVSGTLAAKSYRIYVKGTCLVYYSGTIHGLSIASGTIACGTIGGTASITGPTTNPTTPSGTIADYTGTTPVNNKGGNGGTGLSTAGVGAGLGVLLAREGGWDAGIIAAGVFIPRYTTDPYPAGGGGGGAGAGNNTTLAGGNGGTGGGALFISAKNLIVSGGIISSGSDGVATVNTNCGGGGGGAGGTCILIYESLLMPAGARVGVNMSGGVGGTSTGGEGGGAGSNGAGGKLMQLQQ